MTVPPVPTIIEIGLNAGGAARNRATQATVPVDCAELDRRQSPCRRSTLSPRLALERQHDLRASRHRLMPANRARTLTANAPPALSP
jgi:hypothetical protein